MLDLDDADLAADLLEEEAAPAPAPAQRTAWQQRARAEAVARYGSVADPGTVAACFDAAVRTMGSARVTDYLPVLVERRLRDVLGRVPAQRLD